MRNACKTGGSVKKKYQAGGPIMKPTKIATGPKKTLTPAEKAKGFDKFKKDIEKQVGNSKFPTPKKQMGGVIVASPIEGPRRKVAGSNMAKGGSAHPGFKAVQAKIAAKSGVSKQAAGAILAASTRKASAKAKAANPKLKRVKG